MKNANVLVYNHLEVNADVLFSDYQFLLDMLGNWSSSSISKSLK